MYHRDYLIKLIQQFIVFLAEMAGLRKKNDPDVILMKLESAYLHYTGMNMQTLHSLSAEGIITVFSASGEINFNRILITGLLFKEEADVLFSIKDYNSAEKLYKKALILLIKIEGNESSIFSELRLHLPIKDEIQKKLSILTEKF
jgi:hypothetical protein